MSGQDFDDWQYSLLFRLRHAGLQGLAWESPAQQDCAGVPSRQCQISWTRQQIDTSNVTMLNLGMLPEHPASAQAACTAVSMHFMHARSKCGNSCTRHTDPTCG